MERLKGSITQKILCYLGIHLHKKYTGIEDEQGGELWTVYLGYTIKCDDCGKEWVDWR